MGHFCLQLGSFFSCSDTILGKTSQGYVFWMDSPADSEEFDSGDRRSSFEPQSQGNEEALMKDNNNDIMDNSVISSDDRELSECQSEVISKGVDDSVSVNEERHFSDFETNVKNLHNLFITGDKSDFEGSMRELRDTNQDNFVTSTVERDRFEIKDKTVDNSFVTADQGVVNVLQYEVKDDIHDNSVNLDDEKGICEIQSEMNDKNLDNTLLSKRGLENDKSLDIRILSDDEGVRGSFESQVQKSQEIWGKGEIFDVSVISDYEEVSFEFHSRKRNEEALTSLGSQIILLSDDNNNRLM